MSASPALPTRAAWRNRLYQIIFEADTPAGKTFDIALIIAILFSVALVMLDSVQHIHTQYHRELWVAEWLMTILFSAEYLARLLSAPRPWAYARSVFGLMIESHLCAGAQKFTPGKDQPSALEYGKSITDACLAFDPGLFWPSG